MAEAVRLTVDPDAAEVAPGDRLCLALTVQNTEHSGAHYRLDVSGIPADWYDLDRPFVALVPGASAQTRLTVHPPVSPDTMAGRYTLAVQVRTAEDPAIQASTGVALTVRTGGLDMDLLPDKEGVEYRDPRNEAATEARWAPVLERLGIPILGVRDVPAEAVRLDLDGITWELVPMGTDVYDVPESVYHRIRAAEAAGIPFAYWLWGEECFSRPTFRPVREPLPARAIRLGGEAAAALGTLAAPLGRLVTVLARIDPIVIAVIPTAPNRGLWCSLGAWLH
jgi:hypothetical protein